MTIFTGWKMGEIECSLVSGIAYDLSGEVSGQSRSLGVNSFAFIMPDSKCLVDLHFTCLGYGGY